MPRRPGGPGKNPGTVYTILGIDPGFATTGVGVLRITGGTPAEAAYDCITTKAGREFTLRLVDLHTAVRSTIKSFKPDIMAIERLFFARNVKTAMGVGQAIGVIKLAAAQAGIPVQEYTPMEVKQAVTGSGSGGKKDVAGMVARLLGLDRIPKPDDAADALAIAYCHYAMTRRTRAC
jgi:crossover junction endodeoxyribonuclease RuvC